MLRNGVMYLRDPKRLLSVQIAEAAVAFAEKSGKPADACCLHPAVIAAFEGVSPLPLIADTYTQSDRIFIVGRPE